MIAVDSSIIVAALASWHEAHEPARGILDDEPRLIDHCALEAYSVLTRLPPPHRVEAALVVAFLDDRFPGPVLGLPDERRTAVVRELQAHGVTGGAAYDGLIALTAAAHGATLYTIDRRALVTYRKCGAEAQVVYVPASE